jgi:hypothetical protein
VGAKIADRNSYCWAASNNARQIPATLLIYAFFGDEVRLRLQTLDAPSVSRRRYRYLVALHPHSASARHAGPRPRSRGMGGMPFPRTWRSRWIAAPASPEQLQNGFFARLPLSIALFNRNVLWKSFNICNFLTHGPIRRSKSICL